MPSIHRDVIYMRKVCAVCVCVFIGVQINFQYIYYEFSLFFKETTTTMIKTKAKNEIYE